MESHNDLSSCHVQFDLCRAYVQSLRSLGYVVVEERFDDEGYSGTTLDRPALHRLLGLIRSGGIERLVIYRLDRLSRNLRHFTTLLEELKAHDVELVLSASLEARRYGIRPGVAMPRARRVCPPLVEPAG